MLRRVDVDGQPIAASAEAFGFSRPTFYQAAAAFTRAGLPGLLPQKRGPRRAHKLGAAVMAFVQALRADEAMGARVLARRVEARFGVPVHPRGDEGLAEILHQAFERRVFDRDTTGSGSCSRSAGDMRFTARAGSPRGRSQRVARAPGSSCRALKAHAARAGEQL